MGRKIEAILIFKKKKRMHADMHMNLYIGFFIYFMNSLSMCELKCRVWRIVTFLSARDPLFLLTNKR